LFDITEDEEVAVLSKITKSEFLKFFAKYFSNSSEDFSSQHKLAIYMDSQVAPQVNSTEASPNTTAHVTPSIASVETTFVTDVDTFKHSVPLYPAKWVDISSRL
jgi:hypothetical protein